MTLPDLAVLRARLAQHDAQAPACTTLPPPPFVTEDDGRQDIGFVPMFVDHITAIEEASRWA